MAAKSVAQGFGYSIPILHARWFYPYFLSTGPAVILPVAFVLKFLPFLPGRAAMVVYLIGVSVLFYTYVRRISTPWNAQWATALLISLSAFVNNGKPVLGSVPAFFYVFLGLHLIRTFGPSWKTILFAGLAFGLAILSKLSAALVLCALAVCAVASAVRRDGNYVKVGVGVGIVAGCLLLPWVALECSIQSGFPAFLVAVFNRVHEGSTLTTIGDKFVLLFRFQYAYFAILAALAVAGFFRPSFKLTPFERTLIGSMIVFFFVYFLMREDWYRLLLFTHVLILPFVPIGTERLIGKKKAIVILGFFVFAQGIWQLDHRGSSHSTTAIEAAQYIQEHFADRDLIIQHPEIYDRLKGNNPHWLYYPLSGNGQFVPEHFMRLDDQERCMPRIRNPSAEDREQLGENIQLIVGKYAIIPPPADCPKTAPLR